MPDHEEPIRRRDLAATAQGHRRAADHRPVELNQRPVGLSFREDPAEQLLALVDVVAAKGDTGRVG